MSNATPTATAVHPCPHCGTPVAGPVGTYCCHGCEAAAEILGQAGLEGWYAARQQAAPRVGAVRPVDVAWDRLGVTPVSEGLVEATFAIDGLRCASCTWVCERLLERTDGVEDAHVSYATGRARVRFRADATDLGQVTQRVTGIGYTPRPVDDPGHPDRDLMMRLGVAAFAAANLMGLHIALYAGAFEGMDPRFVQLFRWMALLLATPVATWSAMPFHAGAVHGLRVGTVHMDLPVSLAVGLVSLHGLVATVLHRETYLDSLGMLVALLLAGRVLEARGRRRTAEAATRLAARVPRDARRVTEDGVEEVASDALQPGDRVLLALGDDVPADGVLAAGRVSAALAVLTGESRAVDLGVGDALVAGAVIEDGHGELVVTRAAGDTLLAGMARQLQEAADRPVPPTAADRLAPAFVSATLGVAVATLGLVGLSHGLDEAIARTAAVLVVACPCALALSAPMVGAAGLGAAARRGLLMRRPDALEALAQVDVVMLDKTGTVTGGRPEVVAADPEALRIAAGLARMSRHPVSQALLEAAVAQGVPIPVVDDGVEHPGLGLDGTLDGVGWTLRSGGAGIVRITAEDGPTHLIHLADRPRPEAAADLAALRAVVPDVRLLTGDHRGVAERIGADVGLEAVQAEVDPAGKRAAVIDAQQAGHRVLLVGDGVNDGPALAVADVGIAMQSGAASSVAAAGGVLVGDRLAPLVAGVRVGRLVQAAVHRNLWRSGTYNVLAVLAAVLGWIGPLTAAVLMPLSSGLVIASAAGLDGALRRQEEAT